MTDEVLIKDNKILKIENKKLKLIIRELEEKLKEYEIESNVRFQAFKYNT